MKKTIFALLTIVFATMGLSAQTAAPKDPKMVPTSSTQHTDGNPAALSTAEKVKRDMDKIPADAKLTADQQEKVRAALNEFHAKKDQVKSADGDKKSAEAQGKIKELQNTLNSKLQTILSPEQFQALKSAWKK